MISKLTAKTAQLITGDELIAHIVDVKTPPADRLISLMTFSAWMRWPEDQEVLRYANVVAAANIYLYDKSNGKEPRVSPSVDDMARALVESPLAGWFSHVYETTDLLAGEIVNFFMHCPEELKPSLLKARYFIEQGGFTSEDMTDKERKESTPGSTLLKAGWSEQAIAGPFAWTAESFGEEEGIEELLWIVPDDPDSIPVAEAFLADPLQIDRFFGIARFAQERLLRLLDPVSRSRFKFARFPSSIELVCPDIDYFDEVQLEIMKTYRAPQ